MPNRILKESICTSESLDGLTAFQETFFYRLIVNCDDYGIMDARPRVLASKLFPLKDVRAEQIENALQALTSAELVTLYEVGGKPFLQMKTWERHQQIRAHKSKYPKPDGSFCNHLISSDINCKQKIATDIKCPRNPIQSESNPNPNPTRAWMTDEAAAANQAALDAVLTAAADIGIPQQNRDLFKATQLLGDYPQDWLLEAISRAGDGAATSRSWRYVEGILRRWKQAGAMDAREKAPEKPATRTEKTWVYNADGTRDRWERQVPV